MSLPLPWVDKIFEKLVLVYGQEFLARWRDLDLDAVKQDRAQRVEPNAGYWCVVCGKFLNADELGVIVHDDVSHPPNMTFDDDGSPQ